MTRSEELLLLIYADFLFTLKGDGRREGGRRGKRVYPVVHATAATKCSSPSRIEVYVSFLFDNPINRSLEDGFKIKKHDNVAQERLRD